MQFVEGRKKGRKRRSETQSDSGWGRRPNRNHQVISCGIMMYYEKTMALAAYLIIFVFFSLLENG